MRAMRIAVAAATAILWSACATAQTAPAYPTPEQIRAEREKLEADRRRLEADRADLLRREEQLRRDRAALEATRKSGAQAPVKAASKKTDSKKAGSGPE
jgi:hypothetical protein